MPLCEQIKPLILGIGLCSSAGQNCAQNWENVKNAKANFRKQEFFISPKYSEKFFALSLEPSQKFAKLNIPYCAKILYQAIDEALNQAKLSDALKAKCGVFVGTCIAEMFEPEKALKAHIKEGSENFAKFRYYECASLAEQSAKFFKLGGPRMTISTACSSAGLALEAASQALSDCIIDAALVCGTDVVSQLSVNGFGSLLLMTESTCKPFDKNRDGINLGDAGAAVILIRQDKLAESSKNVLAKISASASSCDAYHATAPHPEGLGVIKAIKDALKKSGLSSADISAICAHGTGTAGNDPAELLALKTVFAENLPPYFSLKGIYGHTLGGSGLVNAIISVCALNEDILPKSAGFTEADPEISVLPNTETRNLKLDSILSNSFGFGGNNSALIISKYKDESDTNSKPCKLSVNVYLNAAGVISPIGNSFEDFSKNFGQIKNNVCDTSSLLKSTPPLKKRKLARIQQMLLDATEQALAHKENFDAQNSCVCFATGLGMLNETAKFMENAFRKDEAEPLPSLFANSVHNAPAAAVANRWKIMGLNSAITAKEMSFEFALWQALAQIKYDDKTSLVLAAADEINEYAQKFKAKSALYCKSKLELGEAAISYLAGNKCEDNSIKIISVDIAKKENFAEANITWIKEKFANANLEISEISAWFTPAICNSFEEKLFAQIFNYLAPKKLINISEHVGLSYINSAYFPLIAKTLGKGKYAQLNFSSTGQRALTILEVL